MNVESGKRSNESTVADISCKHSWVFFLEQRSILLVYQDGDAIIGEQRLARRMSIISPLGWTSSTWNKDFNYRPLRKNSINESKERNLRLVHRYLDSSRLWAVKAF